MKNLKEFNIPFVGLKEGKHLFDYQIDKTFFTIYNFDEFNDVNINVDIEFVKKATLLELFFSSKGTVNIPCDVTNELFNLETTGQFHLIVKFGPEFNDDNEEILILPHEAYEINVAQYIYELIVLSVPQKRVHPKVLDGTMQNTELEKLRTSEFKKETTVEKNTTDPRWDKLKELLTGKNT